MQQTIRNAGISFLPEEWPTADTRIELWRDGSFVDRDSIAPDLEALLPQWLEPTTTSASRKSPTIRGGLEQPTRIRLHKVWSVMNKLQK
jgi:hypothetical protein